MLGSGALKCDPESEPPEPGQPDDLQPCCCVVVELLGGGSGGPDDHPGTALLPRLCGHSAREGQRQK